MLLNGSPGSLVASIARRGTASFRLNLREERGNNQGKAKLKQSSSKEGETVLVG